MKVMFQWWSLMSNKLTCTCMILHIHKWWTSANKNTEKYKRNEISGGMVRWLKKLSKETITRARIWYASVFEMAQNPYHFSPNSFFFSNLSHLNIFELKKWASSVKKHVTNILRRNYGKHNGSNFEPSRNQMHMLASVIVSFDYFLSHLTIPSG